VLAFCATRGLDSTRVLALADGPNDIELLTSAAVRLVPAVAHPAALALADHVIPSAADGGWAQVLDHLE
jgi:hydroxymethylpyrimidine pyrophosphatase-like HAD family hydrolase